MHSQNSEAVAFDIISGREPAYSLSDILMLVLVISKWANVFATRSGNRAAAHERDTARI